MSAIASALDFPNVTSTQPATFVCRAFASEPRGLATGTTYLLNGPLSEGLSLLKYLTVVIEPDESGCFVASEEFIGCVYGVGATKVDAINDLVTSLVEYYGHVTRIARTSKGPAEDLLRHVQAWIGHRT